MTAAQFIAAYPRFKAESTANVTRVIAATVTEFDVGLWGSRYEYYLGLLVAHRLEMANLFGTAGDGGSITHKQVGSVSVTRSEEMLLLQARQPLMLTPYGREYLAMAARVGMGGLAV